MSAIRLNYYLRRRTAVGIIAIQALMVLFCLNIGVSDTTSSLTFASRIRGALFLLAGVALIVGIIAVIGMVAQDNPQWGPPALAGAILSLVVGLSMIIIQSRALEHAERLPYWIVMALACL